MARWDSGRREPRWFAREEQTLRARFRRSQTLEKRLNRRYGAKWPERLVTAYAVRYDTLTRAADALEDSREESWFPADAIEDIRAAVGNIQDFPTLLEDLFVASRHLAASRRRAQQGDPHLTADQRARLQRLDDALTALLMECSDVDATRRLVGGWAEAGLLQGLTFAQLIGSAAALHSEVAMRLSDRRREKHRPKDHALHTFYRDVVLALMRANVVVAKSRRGVAPSLFRVLLALMDEQVAEDPFRDLKRAVVAAEAEVLRRAKSRDAWDEFDQPDPLVQ